MNKVMKAVAALMLMMAVICTAGCNKKPENPDDPEQTVTLTGLWYANDQWFENEHDREAMDFVNSNTLIWYGTVSTNKNAYQDMEGVSMQGCEGWYYFSKTYYTYVLTDNKIFFNDRVFTVFDGYLVEDGSSSQWKPWDDGNGGGGGGGDVPSTVTVTTYNPTDITSTEATCCADVTAESGSNIRELGVCWGTSAYPTVENSHLSTTTWNTPFVCTISDLVPETRYHVRAYALNGTSYVYGDDKTFTTLPKGGGGGGETYTIAVSVNPSIGGMVSGGGAYQQGQTCTVNAVANIDYSFENWTENGTLCSFDENYSFVVNGNRFFVANFTYNGGGGVDDDYVDLGLPSGLLWATRNVGANSPEDYGDYFAWGETQMKNTYDWSTYQYCMGSKTTLTKYCDKASSGYNGFTDSLTILLPEDDVATVNWGSDWRMPTEEDCQDLIDNCILVWTTQNGVNGIRFTGPNGNTIFLPAGGYYNQNSFHPEGWSGEYWSSSLGPGSSSLASAFILRSNYHCVGGGSRHCGRSVRAVRSACQN